MRAVPFLPFASQAFSKTTLSLPRSTRLGLGARLSMMLGVQLGKGDIGGGGRPVAQRRLGVQGGSVIAGHGQELSLGRQLVGLLQKGGAGVEFGGVGVCSHRAKASIESTRRRHTTSSMHVLWRTATATDMRR